MSAFLAAAVAPALAQAPPPGGPAKHHPGGGKHHEPPAVIAQMTKDVLAADVARVNAWKAGDAAALAAVTDDDAVAIFGPGAPGHQLLTKTAFLQMLAANRPAAGVVLGDQAARLFGAQSDTAVVTGTLKDPAKPGDAGLIYTAVYVRSLDSWSLVRYIISSMARAPFPPAPPPAPNWSPDSLAATPRKVVEGLHAYFDELARREWKAMDATLGDNYMEVHGNTGAGVQVGKQAMIDFKTANPGAPELIGMDEPDVQMYGNYGDTAVLVGVRRDATGGAIYGNQYNPVWRNVALYVAVLERAGLHSDLWQPQHYHAAYVNPQPGDTAPYDPLAPIRAAH